jgi:hypothetical protein
MLAMIAVVSTISLMQVNTTLIFSAIPWLSVGTAYPKTVIFESHPRAESHLAFAAELKSNELGREL